MRLRITTTGRLRAVEDTFEVQDPLGLGITFTLFRRDARKHLEFLDAQSRRDPTLTAIADRVALAVFDSLDKPDPEASSGDVPTVAAADAPDVFLGSESKAIAELIREGKFSSIDVFRRHAASNLEEAVALVKGWSGEGIVDADTSKPVLCTPANVRDLLTSDAEVTEGEHEGKTLGEVLLPWVLEQASQRTRRALRVIEEAVKASAPPSVS
jgi:hypothetical protein